MGGPDIFQERTSRLNFIFPPKNVTHLENVLYNERSIQISDIESFYESYVRVQSTYDSKSDWKYFFKEMRHGEIVGFSSEHWVNVSRITYPETKCDKGYEYSDLMMMMACDYEKFSKVEKMSSPIHMVSKEDDHTIRRCILLQDGN